MSKRRELRPMSDSLLQLPQGRRIEFLIQLRLAD